MLYRQKKDTYIRNYDTSLLQGFSMTGARTKAALYFCVR